VIAVKPYDHGVVLRNRPHGAAWRIAATSILLFLYTLTSPELLDAGPVHRATYLRFGVLPSESPIRLAEMFLPLTHGISLYLKRPIEFVTAPSFSMYIARVRHHKYQILYLNPPLLRHAERFGYHAIVRIVQDPFVGIVVARKGGPIRRLSPAALPWGLTIGFADPQAYAATVVVKQYLNERGFQVGQNPRVRYFGTQNSVLLAVASGVVALGGTCLPSLQAVQPEVRKQIKILARTAPQPLMPIAVIDSMSESEVKALQDYLVSLPYSASGREILHALGSPYGFTRVPTQGMSDLGFRRDRKTKAVRHVCPINQ
jgi:phosphonate transport system substrate-binding protein